MMKSFGSKYFVGIAFTLVLLLAPEVSRAQEKQHPSLVNPETAKCETCHAQLLQGNVHPAILEGGCSTCHTLQKKDGKTVAIMELSGNELCGACHEKQAERAASPQHHAPLEDCLTCHSPHASENQRLLLYGLPDLCAQCHELSDLTAAHNEQPIQRSTCVVCHDPHGTDQPPFLVGKNQHPPFQEGSCDACHKKARGTKVRMVSAQPELCFACHDENDLHLDSKHVHKPVTEGQCTDCHNPHMSDQKRFLKAPVPQLCLNCHTDVKEYIAKGNTVHPPAEEDCRTCHEPHASQKEHLIVADIMTGEQISSLCSNCHDLADLSPKHRGARMEPLACTTCHNPHGSKQKKLINSISVHPPFEDSCDNCHTKGIALSEPMPDLCFVCHDDVQKQAETAGVPHPAVELGCTSCHTPHASSYPPLFQSSMISTCGSCHDDTGNAMANNRYLHGVIQRIGCQACHTPHGGDNPKLLKKKIPELCLSCHQEGTAELAPKIVLNVSLEKDHPIKGHSISPNGGSCLSCHDPHSGQNPSLFKNQIETDTELCATCHSK